MSLQSGRQLGAAAATMAQFVAKYKLFSRPAVVAAPLAKYWTVIRYLPVCVSSNRISLSYIRWGSVAGAKESGATMLHTTAWDNIGGWIRHLTVFGLWQGLMIAVKGWTRRRWRIDAVCKKLIPSTKKWQRRHGYVFWRDFLCEIGLNYW